MGLGNMGFAIDPNSTFEYVLVTDKQKPEAEQTKFRFRYLSARDCAQMDDLFYESFKADSNNAGFEMVLTGIKKALVGWHNAKDSDGNIVEFDADKLDIV